MRILVVALLSCLAVPVVVAAEPCNSGVVFEDRNGDGHQDDAEAGIAGIKVSDGVEIVVTDTRGAYRLPVVDGRTTFVIKPAGYRLVLRDDGLPDHWRNVRLQAGPLLKYGGLPVAVPACKDFPLVAESGNARHGSKLDVVVFADPQTKSPTDVDYYRRDIVQPLLDSAPAGNDAIADLGLSLGDIVNDDLSLYPSLNAHTAMMKVPWLHVAGNHDLDFDAARDEDSLLTFRHHFGPDTFAWEEREAVFVVLDDVVYRPGQTPAYIGGLREDQFAFLERYLPTVPKERLLVIAVHIPFFDAAPGRQTFRHSDRDRLFALLKGFPHVLLLSGHSHTQRHVFHGAANGWPGAGRLHEYNVGAACGAFWSGVKDAQGIPDSSMSDGTPNGFARLRVSAGGEYALSWHPARAPIGDATTTEAMSLHAPKVLRRGAWPAWAVYANVYMGRDDSRVEYRIDEGEWKPMSRVEQPDPRLLAENARDDQADALRGYDRSPEATPSRHLWRGVLATDLRVGEHRVEVRTFDAWQGEQRAQTHYRLDDARSEP
ncbi:MAG TPA: calcineurin-like phosphoesterase family protein [Lysobacter sp.]